MLIISTAIGSSLEDLQFLAVAAAFMVIVILISAIALQIEKVKS